MLEPQQARGRNDFENMKAVYMTNNRLEAALYAIAKHLKNKTTFGVRNNKLVILGDGDPAPGWLYELSANDVIPGGEGQFASLSNITPSSLTRVTPQELAAHIRKVNSINDFLSELDLTIDDLR